MQCHMAHVRTMVDADITENHPVTTVKEDAGQNKTRIGTEVALVEP